MIFWLRDNKGIFEKNSSIHGVKMGLLSVSRIKKSKLMKTSKLFNYSSWKYKMTPNAINSQLTEEENSCIKIWYSQKSQKSERRKMFLSKNESSSEFICLYSMFFFQITKKEATKNKKKNERKRKTVSQTENPHLLAIHLENLQRSQKKKIIWKKRKITKSLQTLFSSIHKIDIKHKHKSLSKRTMLPDVTEQINENSLNLNVTFFHRKIFHFHKSLLQIYV